MCSPAAFWVTNNRALFFTISVTATRTRWRDNTGFTTTTAVAVAQLTGNLPLKFKPEKPWNSSGSDEVWQSTAFSFPATAAWWSFAEVSATIWNPTVGGEGLSLEQLRRNEVGVKGRVEREEQRRDLHLYKGEITSFASYPRHLLPVRRIVRSEQCFWRFWCPTMHSVLTETKRMSFPRAVHQCAQRLILSLPLFGA